MKKVGKIGRGPRWAQGWADDAADAINSNAEETITRIQFALGGDKGQADLGGVGGSGGGSLETVTGAVNGVPATLNVLTDGSGWVEI